MGEPGRATASSRSFGDQTPGGAWRPTDAFARLVFAIASVFPHGPHRQDVARLPAANVCCRSSCAAARSAVLLGSSRSRHRPRRKRTNDRRISAVAATRPPPRLLRGKLPEVDPVPEPVVVVLAHPKRIATDEATSNEHAAGHGGGREVRRSGWALSRLKRCHSPWHREPRPESCCSPSGVRIPTGGAGRIRSSTRDDARRWADGGESLFASP